MKESPDEKYQPLINRNKQEPYQSNFAPEANDEGRKHAPFLNEHGVLIGDGKYASENSPLEHWNSETDPAVMAGDQWVHPYNDVGFNTEENREYFEEGVSPQSYPFMHPTKDVTFRKD